jgi:hypothetical protein
MSEITIAAMMKYCARMARRAEVIASRATRIVVTTPTARKFRRGKTVTTLSAKPTV